MYSFNRLQTEVSEVLGSKTEITYDDLTKLVYTTCVFKETLRKWPLVSELYRVSTSEITINGMILPQNTWIMVRYIHLKYQKSLVFSTNYWGIFDLGL